jgi:hypothetical protein
VDALLSTLLQLLNETLTAATVIVAASILLYNLTRNLRNRVARASGMVLASVTIVSLFDAFIALGPTAKTLDASVRIQWIGIALIPAAMFHLSDALLETTGLPSRGRRTRIIRLLYFIGIAFIVAAAFTDVLIAPQIIDMHLVNILSGPLFWVYVAYFIVGTGVGFINMQRARKRCLTRDTRRRMGYLQFAMLTPPFGIFPYSVLFGLSETSSVAMLVVVNLANVVIILTLLFLAYPLSFFGTQVPDRVVKAELLDFALRGPATGLLVLATINFATPISQALDLPGNSFLPFAVVAVALLWQWSVALALPKLEKLLIYADEDNDQLTKLQSLSERLLTRSDLLQLLEAIASACCDYLQVNTAFVVAFSENKPDLITAIGPSRPSPKWLEDETPTLFGLFDHKNETDLMSVHSWHSYWIVPLHSNRMVTEKGEAALIGFMGIQARSNDINLTTDEQATFKVLTQRAAETLDDLNLQTEIYGALEGLLPQIVVTRTRAATVEYRPGHERRLTDNQMPAVERESFIEQVRAALRHYWGGAGLTGSRLLELKIVHQALPENGDNAARALRAVLSEAIDRQRPQGERKMLNPEWTIYNILEQRFIERNKVRDVAIKLALSEPDLYRKQRIAIEAVADTLIEMEQNQKQLESG